jgi:membrane protease YdiL (CAAX protease family)
MESSDQLVPEDLEAVGIAVARMRRRSLLAAALGGVVFSVVVFLLWLWLHPRELQAAAFLALATYICFGLPLFVHWLRHWRKIERKLSDVTDRVKAGEIVYGSQVSFS